ncbi:MAG TPA: hypothetical protein VMT30_08385 [Candidatus Saccharimonadia bacterium]|nr:hypothetical protein [Candidatus Saccharimonadia bacterium]
MLRLAWRQAPDGVTIRYRIGHQREITITDGRHEHEGLEFPVPAEIGDEIKLSITPVFENEFTPTNVRCFIYQIKFGRRIEGHVDPPHGYTPDALESAHCKWVVTP